MKKSLLFVGLLTFSSMIFAAAKSYTVTIVAPTKVGTTELAKGSYTLHVEGDKAVFTDAKSKTYAVPVKLETGTGKKFEFTSVESTHKDGGDAIKLIHLAGSTTTVEFGD
jgi:hypothetical protein